MGTLVNFGGLKGWLEKFTSRPDRETPEPGHVKTAHLVIVVGHTKKNGGARFCGKTWVDEYDYNSEVAALCEKISENDDRLKVTTIFRDQIGLVGAYEKANRCEPDALISLHFNAYNGAVTGSETLCAPKGRDFAKWIHKASCEAFNRNGQSRGVKVIPRSSPGGFAVYSCGETPVCLAEPFFGDNQKEAKIAVNSIQDYASALIKYTIRFLESENLIE